MPLSVGLTDSPKPHSAGAAHTCLQARLGFTAQRPASAWLPARVGGGYQCLPTQTRESDGQDCNSDAPLAVATKRASLCVCGGGLRVDDTCAHRRAFFHTYVTYSHIYRYKCSAPKLKAFSAEYFCLPCRRFPHYTSGIRHTNPPPPFPLRTISGTPPYFIIKVLLSWNWKLSSKMTAFLRIFAQHQNRRGKGQFKCVLFLYLLDESPTPVNPSSPFPLLLLKASLKHYINCRYFLLRRRLDLCVSTVMKWER